MSIKTYYHNLHPEIDALMEDYPFIDHYTTQNGHPLVMYSGHEKESDKYQFIQAIIPDEKGNRHIFMALLDYGNIVIEESLWAIEQILATIYSQREVELLQLHKDKRNE